MQKRYVIAIVIAVIALIALILLYMPTAVDPDAHSLPDNTAGPAEGGALETGGALDSDAGYRNLPARDMPNTVSEYPPTGPETDNPPPPK